MIILRNTSPTTKPANSVKTQTQAAAVAPEGSGGLVAQSLGTQAAKTEHYVWAYFEDEPDLLYDQDTRENGEILGVIECPDAYDGEDVVITSWNMYDINDFFDGKPPLETNVECARVIKADDPEDIVLTPNFVSVHSKRVNLWLNKAMTGFDKDVLIGSFDVYDGGYYYIAYTDLPDGISDDGFDVLYYGDNKNLVDREGVVLDGWVNAADNSDDMVGFLPDDFVDYDELPDGDTVDLFAVWYDPLVYGITYHANRSGSDGYTVETAQFSYDGSTLMIDGIEAGDEDMENSGKTFKGWNTAADGSGEWVDEDKAATLSQLGFGTRAQYIEDLEELAELQVEETPIYDTGAAASDSGAAAGGLQVQAAPTNDTGVAATESGTAADELEGKIEEKYTAHLYAQWADSPAKAKALGKVPSTGDTMMPMVWAIVGIAVIAAAIAAAAAARLAFARRRR